MARLIAAARKRAMMCDAEDVMRASASASGRISPSARGISPAPQRRGSATANASKEEEKRTKRRDRDGLTRVDRSLAGLDVLVTTVGLAPALVGRKLGNAAAARCCRFRGRYARRVVLYIFSCNFKLHFNLRGEERDGDEDRGRARKGEKRDRRMEDVRSEGSRRCIRRRRRRRRRKKNEEEGRLAACHRSRMQMHSQARLEALISNFQVASLRAFIKSSRIAARVRRADASRVMRAMSFVLTIRIPVCGST